MATKTNPPQQEKNKDFGLPQEEFKPIESEAGKWLKITAIIVSLVLSVGAGTFYWFFYLTPAEEHKSETPEANIDFTESDVSTTHQYTKEDTQTSTLANELETLTIEGKEDFKASHATNLEKGTITKINVPRGCYYVVVGSFVDGDLASDYANRLAQQGVNAMIITPPKGRHFFRVAIEEEDTFYDANEKMASLKAEYGTDIWVMKY